MKKYSKKEAIRIITLSAKEYSEYLSGYKFVLAYRDSTELKYSIIRFEPRNFKHLTGVFTKDSAARFYKKCLDGQLSPDDFEFDAAGNTHLKLAVLPIISRMFFGHALRGDFLRTGIRIEADYFVGTSGHLVSLAFREKSGGDYPVSLYCEDIRKLTLSTQKIIGIWRLYKGISENTYVAKGENPDEIKQQLINIKAPL